MFAKTLEIVQINEYNRVYDKGARYELCNNDRNVKHIGISIKEQSCCVYKAVLIIGEGKNCDKRKSDALALQERYYEEY